MLGRRERFDAIPTFWTEQYDFGLAYVSYAEGWDKAELDGQLDADTRNCTVTCGRSGRKAAVAIVQRDLDLLGRLDVLFLVVTDRHLGGLETRMSAAIRIG